MKETTIEILKKAGWYPNRKIDITDLVVNYEKRGFEMFSEAKKFLQEYGLLDIYSPIDPKLIDKDLIKYGYDGFKLNTTKVDQYIITGSLSRDYVIEYEEDYVEEKLVMVGALTDGHKYLMMFDPKDGKLTTNINKKKAKIIIAVDSSTECGFKIQTVYPIIEKP